MNERVLSVSPSTTIKEAAKLFQENGITGAPVCEDGRLVGLMSRSIFLRAIAEGVGDAGGDGSAQDAIAQLVDIESCEVSRVMRPDPITINPDATVLDAARLMFPNRVNRLMVVDESGIVLGIITSTDVVRIALCDELSELDYGDVDDTE